MGRALEFVATVRAALEFGLAESLLTRRRMGHPSPLSLATLYFEPRPAGFRLLVG